MNPSGDKFSVLKMQQQKLIGTQSNIKTSLKLGTSERKNRNRIKRKSNFNIFSHLKEDVEKDLVLPAVETKDITPKNCLVVDILQLVNCYSSSHKNDTAPRRSSLVSGDSVSRPTLSSIQKQQFSYSAPDAYLKQKRGSFARRSIQISQSDKFNAKSGSDFAKSWPLAPLKRTTAATRLPKIDSIKTSNDLNAGSDFRRDLSKFNQSKKFRMKNLKPLQEHTSTTNNRAIADLKTPLKNVTISDSENLYNIRESIHLNVTGTTNHIVEANYHKEDEAADSERSSFTHVTKEIIENNNENSSFRTALNQQESMELNKKCLKWLEGVAKERLQNPDQIILPHLFIT